MNTQKKHIKNYKNSISTTIDLSCSWLSISKGEINFNHIILATLDQNSSDFSL